MRNRIFKISILGLVFLLTAITFNSCQKAKDTIGVIIVKDSSGNTVSGAQVVLHQDDAISPQGNTTNTGLRKTEQTDVNGRAEFTYKLEAIFQVDVEKVDGNNIYTGSNMIRLLKEKTVTQIVEIN